MRMLVDVNIRKLFSRIGLSILGFTLLSAVAVSLQRRFAVLWILVTAIGMGVAGLYLPIPLFSASGPDDGGCHHTDSCLPFR